MGWGKRIHDFLKTGLARANLAFYRARYDTIPPQPAPERTPNTLRGIVFLRQDGKIGDYVVSAFVFREIKRANPHIQIGVICSAKNRQIFENNPYIDHLHEVKPKSLRDYARLGKTLAGQYDVAIEPSLQFRPRDLVLLANLRCFYNVGVDKAAYRLFNLNIANSRQPYRDIYAQSLRLCGFDKIDVRFRLPEHPVAAQKVHDFLAHNHLSHYVALNFFGASHSRRFDETDIRAMLRALSQTYPNQAWLLLTFPEVSPMLANIARDEPNVWIMADTQNIDESTELIRHAQLVISPDTAIVHIADALQKPLLAFYPDNAQNTANWSPQNTIFKQLFFHRHIREITPQAVLSALQTLDNQLNILNK